MQTLQAVITGAMQGLSEFLPISSSAHIVFSNELYELITKTAFITSKEEEIFFDIMVHLATLFAVLIYFFNDLKTILKDFFVSIKEKDYKNKNFLLTNYILLSTVITGVIGLIFPADKQYTFSISESGLSYIVSVSVLPALELSDFNGFSINDINGNGGYENDCLTVGFRVYNDNTHSFDAIAKEAEIERNPLTDISVNGGNAEGKFLGYDSLSGAYLFSMKGTDFNYAYQNPDFQYSLPVSIKNNTSDRNIYIRSMGDNGCLEAAAILDDTDTLVPVNVQVCKNFQGDGGEPFYSAEDLQRMKASGAIK